MIRRAAVVVVVAIAAALAVSAPITLARFTSARHAAATLATGTIQPPTELSGTGGTGASLTWTASTSTSATGYRVLRSATSGSGYAQVKNVTPVTATSTSDSPGAGVWYYVLDTYLGGWTSAHSNEASVVIGRQTTTTVGCDPAMQAPVTSGSGNNDGYDQDPGNACAPDGSYATDNSTGTDRVDDCADAGKDRHQFWGYSLGLPGTVSLIDGITVTTVVGMNNNGGSSSVCLELSWDGGTTWTAAKKVPLTASGLTSYTTGSSTDTWGHAWTLGQLASPSFRIRVTDVATTPNKDFHLDYLGVSVGYMP
jgi:hypothetical protein